MYLLGLDIGTTNCKAILFDVEKIKEIICSRKMRTHYTNEGYVFFEPTEIWDSVCSLIQEIIGKVSHPCEIKGLSIASVAETGIPLDKKGTPIYHAIAWFDPRTKPQNEWWEDNFGSNKVYKITGLPLDYIFSVNKIMWIKENEPDIYKRMKKWLCIPDFIIYKLTGEYVTDYSIASRTMALDIKNLRWSSQILDSAEIDTAVMPPISPSGKIAGKVSSRASSETGLERNTLVVTGGHDHLCGALAAGVCQEGQVLDSIGTSETILAVIKEPVLNKELFSLNLLCGCHVVKNRYYIAGGMPSAGLMLDWCRKEFFPGKDTLEETIYQRLTEKAETAEAGSKGLFFLPHFRGSSTLYRDPASRGAFIGLREFHQKAHIVRSVMEGLCYESLSLIEVLESALGWKFSDLTVLCKNDLWLKIKADVTGKTLRIPPNKEPTALGAALLAGIGIGVYKNEVDALKKIDQKWKKIYPNCKLSKRYQLLYREIYKAIYPVLRNIHKKIDQIYSDKNTYDQGNQSGQLRGQIEDRGKLHAKTFSS